MDFIALFKAVKSFITYRIYDATEYDFYWEEMSVSKFFLMPPLLASFNVCVIVFFLKMTAKQCLCNC